MARARSATLLAGDLPVCDGDGAVGALCDVIIMRHDENGLPLVDEVEEKLEDLLCRL